MNSPKVFISHASEDKDRFVVRFAERLCEAGISVWLDEWEMQPGDSLISKIFDEGIGKSGYVVVVVSHVSVSKPWVREELEAAMIRAVEDQVRILPVVIDDDCKVPIPLRSRVYVRIRDLEHYDDEFNRLVNAIIGLSERPDVSTLLPTTAPVVDGLSYADSLVLREAARRVVFEDADSIAPGDLAQSPSLDGLSQPEITESIRVLDEDGLVEIQNTFGVPVRWFRPTRRGLLKWAHTEFDLADIRRRIVALAVNEGLRSSSDLAEALDLKEILVHSILHSFDPRMLSVVDHPDSNAPRGRITEITKLSPRLGRDLG